MRKAAFGGRRWDQTLPSFRPYALLLEWLRLDLAMAFAGDEPIMRDELPTMISDVETELEVYCGDTLERVERLKRRLPLPDARESLESAGAENYRGVVEDIMSIPAKP